MVGVGNIGRALVDYTEFQKQGFYVKALFDNDLKKVGTKLGSHVIHHIDDACYISNQESLEIAVIAVPANKAQQVVDSMVKCGVKAFLNFAPITIKVPQGIVVKNENMSMELEALSYHLSLNKKKG